MYNAESGRYIAHDDWELDISAAATTDSNFHKLYVHAEGLDELLFYAWDHNTDGNLSDNLNRYDTPGNPGDVAAFYLENRMGSVVALVDYRQLNGTRDVYGPATPTSNKSTVHLGSVIQETRRVRVMKYAKYDAFGHATWMEINDPA